jgi:hypothetical protein
MSQRVKTDVPRTVIYTDAFERFIKFSLDPLMRYRHFSRLATRPVAMTLEIGEED